MSAPPINQPSQPVTMQQIMVKMMLDSQNNINKLVDMQEQQMVYINTLFKQVIDESAAIQQQYQQQQTPPSTSSAVSTQSGTIKTTTAKESQPTDSQPITEENKTI